MSEQVSQQMQQTEEALVTPKRIMEMAFGFAAPLMMHAAIQNRIFDTLDGGPMPLDEICEQTHASERGVRALLNGLVDLLLTDDHGRYRLAPDTAEYLVSSKPMSHTEILRHFAQELIPNWLNLDTIVRTGQPSITVEADLEGTVFFEKFVESLFPMSYPAAKILANALNLDRATGPISVLDLAAGSGVWGIALAQKSTTVKVTAIDRAKILNITKQVAERCGVADQLKYVAGDLHTADFGAGHAVATLGHILHSEGEERSRSLLRKVFQALSPGGTICIADFLTNDTHTAPPMSLIFGVNMLVHTQEGDTFSFAEIATWLTDAGFTNTRTLDVPGPSPLILATKW